MKVAATNAMYSSRGTSGVGSIGRTSDLRMSENPSATSSLSGQGGLSSSNPSSSLSVLKSYMEEKKMSDAMKVFEVLMTVFPDIDAAEARSLAQQF